MDLRSTLNLPDANATIPMKANLPILEPSIFAGWEEQEIYHRIQQSRLGAEAFVLLDGPPYTNSPIHIGTALNKILKDFVLKSRTMMGYRTPYVPGFDNHGLPIEQAVAKKFAEKKITPTVLELRKACRAHAAEYCEIQTKQFKRLGVFGLWEKPYQTMDYRFEAGIVRVFKRLVAGGHVYKGLRPTLWSPTSRTALAESEIVYRDHVSKAIYVRFPLRTDPDQLLTKFQNVHTIIWTTTPWTIPANLAVAFHPEMDYAVVRVNGRPGPAFAEETDETATYVILDALVEKVANTLGWTNYEVLEQFPGLNLTGVEFSHPIFGRPSISVMADYVTTEDGTGVVHTAPSHGRDDFYTGQKYGLPVPNTVDERGVLTHEAGEFEGTFYKTCDTVVVNRLIEVGALLSVKDFHHSYPYAERDELPVIFRATEQWFVAIDPMRHDMLTAIDGVNWVPPQGQNRIDAMVRHRPDWCISRQRPWGVGIPVFYGAKSRVPVLDETVIEHVARIIEAEGSDAWFERSAADLLPPGFIHPATGETEFEKETDVLDVWFDSGAVSVCVLEGEVYPEWKEHYPADLFFEGSDQHRGWFNSSLVLGMGCRAVAPYKTVVTHGFVTDGEGRKISKRLGNGVDPVVAADQYGADVLRLWVASVNYENDAPVSDAILKSVGEVYRNVRNTLRFLLGNLGGIPADAAVTLELDRWVCEQADLLVADVVDAYARYDFGAVTTAVNQFCLNQLSKFYLDAIKDRMYCEAQDSAERISGQAASAYVLERLVTLVAPILPFTAEETWQKMASEGVVPTTFSVHAELFRQPSEERLAEIEASPRQVHFASLRALTDEVAALFEKWKVGAGIKNGEDAVVRLPEAKRAELEPFSIEELALFLRFSWVEIGGEEIAFEASPYLRCERSRLRRPDVALVLIDGAEVPLSARDRRVIGV